ncbi:hypothetical protein Val02_36970 [Virgisporangium aliadipatigenens]|uniref:Secreted protein n=1 Tax=Virgisporangium aliadipatigenens TaxID=741659 RepID=A0A8J4DR85_9ACTN|nr:hypothetical protein [Virgisporangium aliadipatigenens]GIJ46811.1 hypothetical protein Val02_36970 [Virgisporangium aliadipatigenens]
MSSALRRLTSGLLSLTVGLAAATSVGPAAAHADTRPTLPRPEVAGAGDAPLGGVVPGRTGADIRASVEAQAAHRERALARAGGVTVAAQEHPAAGTYFSRQSQSTAIRATHTVFYGTGDRTRVGDVVYAPTLMPPSSACLEITTAYTWDAPALWAWDWCTDNPGVGKEVPLNANFVSTYTTPVNGLPAYSIDIQKTNAATNTWTAYLYNFKNGRWDTFWAKSGTSQIGQNGWDVFEPYVTRNPSTGLGYYCATMAGRTFEARGIQVRVNGTYQNASASTGASYYWIDLACGSRLRWTQNDLANWSARIS